MCPRGHRVQGSPGSGCCPSPLSPIGHPGRGPGGHPLQAGIGATLPVETRGAASSAHAGGAASAFTRLPLGTAGSPHLRGEPCPRAEPSWGLGSPRPPCPRPELHVLRTPPTGSLDQESVPDGHVILSLRRSN